MPSSLGKRLLAFRNGKGWSQLDLAKRLRTGKAIIGLYEHDRRYPRQAVLGRIARMLGTTAGDLYGETAGFPLVRDAPKSRRSESTSKAA